MKASARLIRLFFLAFLNIFPLEAVLAINEGCDASNMTIVVVPHYMEKGALLGGDSQEYRAYRRVLRHINANLVNMTGAQVRNPADIGTRSEKDRVFWETTYQKFTAQGHKIDPSLSRTISTNIASEYGSDMVYLFWLKMRSNGTYSDFCQVSAVVEGDGYDTAGNDLALAAIRGKVSITRLSCEDARERAQVRVGEFIGEKLATWVCAHNEADFSSVRTEPGQRNAGVPNRNFIDVRIKGLWDFTQISILQTILSGSDGVLGVKVYGSSISASKPGNSHAYFQVQVDGLTADKLVIKIEEARKSAINKELLGSKSSGYFRLSGYSEEQLVFLNDLEGYKLNPNVIKYRISH
ncbi:MAG: hypothetical protein ABW168_08275 [Sedimenticola sp.]